MGLLATSCQCLMGMFLHCQPAVPCRVLAPWHMHFLSPLNTKCSPLYASVWLVAWLNVWSHPTPFVRASSPCMQCHCCDLPATELLHRPTDAQEKNKGQKRLLTTPVQKCILHCHMHISAFAGVGMVILSCVTTDI